jgi:hypothetical protein
VFLDQVVAVAGAAVFRMLVLTPAQALMLEAAVVVVA